MPARSASRCFSSVVPTASCSSSRTMAWASMRRSRPPGATASGSSACRSARRSSAPASTSKRRRVRAPRSWCAWPWPDAHGRRSCLTRTVTRRGRRVRVLLADDHATVRYGLKLLIDAEPDMTVVAEAGDGRRGRPQGAGGEAGCRGDGHLDARDERACRHARAEAGTARHPGHHADAAHRGRLPARAAARRRVRLCPQAQRADRARCTPSAAWRPVASTWIPR